MKRILVLTGLVFMFMVPSCGRRSEESIAEKQIEQKTDSEKRSDISEDSVGMRTTKREFETAGGGEETSNLKQEKNLNMDDAEPVNVGDNNFRSEVLESDIPVLVDFWAPWCGPCSRAAPVLEKIAQQYQGRLKVCKLNVDEGRQTAMKYSIRAIPTLKIFMNGEAMDQIVGVTPSYESDIMTKIKPYLD